MAKKRAASSAQSAKAKKGRNLTVPQKVAQKIRDTFGDLTREEVDVNVNPDDGKTLRQRLEADMLKLEKGEEVESGKKYHDGLREKYRSKTSQYSLLTVGPTEESGEVDPVLMKALCLRATCLYMSDSQSRSVLWLY